MAIITFSHARNLPDGMISSAASDMIHLIFRNVQEEFEESRRKLVDKNGDGNGNATPAAAAGPAAPVLVSGPAETAPASDGNRAPSNRKRNILLATAGAGVAVGALTLFFVLSDDDPKTRTIVVNE